MVTIHPSAGNTLTLRVSLERVPGTLGRLTSALGAAGALVDAIDILEHHGDVIVRQIQVETSSEEHGLDVVAAVRRVDGVELLSVTDRVFDRHRGGKIEVTPRFPVLTRDDGGQWRISLQLGEHKYTAVAGEPLQISTRTGQSAVQDWLRFPVGGIDWDDAQTYVRWLDDSGRVSGARLCSEVEWERAARGADGRKFPTGDVVAADDANFDETHARDFAAMGPDVVGSHPASASPFGLHDTMGNVWEWVIAGDGAGAGAGPVARGGAFFFDKLTGSPMNRNVLDPGFRDGTLGLRVCVTPRFPT